MNWKLIFQLSLFGLAMGIGTVFVIPSSIEPLFWLAVFGISSYLIALRCSAKHFLHGFFVSIVNSVWVTASHVLLFDYYVANHAQEMELMATIPFSASPRAMMLAVGVVSGVVSGLILGLIAFITSRFVHRRT